MIINIGFVLIIIAVIVKVFSGQSEEIWRQLKSMTLITLGLVVLCSVFFNLFDGLAYYFMGKRYNDKFTVLQGIGCSYYCAFFKLSTFGTATAASGVYYLSGYNVPPANSLGMITINYIIQKVSVVVLCLVFFATHFGVMQEHYSKYFHYIILGVVLTVIVAIGLLMAVMWKKFHNLLLFIADRIIKKEELKDKIKSLEEQLSSLRNETARMLKEKKFIISVFFANLIKFLGWYMIPCVVIGYTDINNILVGLCISALASALIGVIPAPGAAGSTEAMFYALFCVVVPDAKAVAVMLMYRCFTYIFPFIVGGIFILIRKFIYRRRLHKIMQ